MKVDNPLAQVYFAKRNKLVLGRYYNNPLIQKVISEKFPFADFILTGDTLLSLSQLVLITGAAFVAGKALAPRLSENTQWFVSVTANIGLAVLGQTAPYGAVLGGLVGLGLSIKKLIS